MFSEFSFDKEELKKEIESIAQKPLHEGAKHSLVWALTFLDRKVSDVPFYLKQAIDYGCNDAQEILNKYFPEA